MTKRTAPLDRRVRVIPEFSGPELPACRVSDLRHVPFLVLLGEPGIGKSTVLQQEAAHENGVVVRARDLTSGSSPMAGSPLFIDALDEYRIDGEALHKIHKLGNALRAAAPPKWRVACRAEDWRKHADAHALRDRSDEHEIVVAQLLPLQHDESAGILRNFGDSDPDTFIAKAHALGARAFLENPLSLELLHKSIVGGSGWPGTRHELFRTAIISLAHEHDREHKAGRLRTRNPVPEIIEAAERASLVMLVSGRRALWRSNDEPAPVDERTHVRHYELELQHDVFRDMLDTSLFRGEGESFEPMHRTIAEYLAGRALAKAVAGHPHKVAFPLGRAVALLIGLDGKPPIELRGAYAWFAAHLATLGSSESAKRMIESDTATVLAYGDAAVLPTPLRRALFQNLGKDDPYFRSGDHRYDTAIGGLAGEDLAEDFSTVLEAPNDTTHRMVTVFDALTNGTPVESLRPLLYKIALDPGRLEWQRSRACEAWLNGASEKARALLDAIAATPPSRTREALRIGLAAQLPPESLSNQAIKDLIGDFSKSENSNTVGQLYGLTRSLRAIPRGELFDIHVDTWISRTDRHSHSVNLERFLDEMLAAAIQHTAGVTAEDVWRWSTNVRGNRWDDLPEHSSKRLRAWLDADPKREAELLDLVVADTDGNEGPHIPVHHFVLLTGQLPSVPHISHLLSRAQTGPNASENRRLLAVAIEIARHLPDGQVHTEIKRVLAAQQKWVDLLPSVVFQQAAEQSEPSIRRQQAALERHLQQKARNIEVLTPMISDLHMGRHSRNLALAAKRYFYKEDSDERVGVLRVIHETNEEIAAAILMGWRYVITQDFQGITARMLGESIFKTEYDLEWVALAGVHHLLTEPQGSPIPIPPVVVAITVLKGIWSLTARVRVSYWKNGRSIDSDRYPIKAPRRFWISGHLQWMWGSTTSRASHVPARRMRVAKQLSEPLTRSCIPGQRCRWQCSGQRCAQHRYDWTQHAC